MHLNNLNILIIDNSIWFFNQTNSPGFRDYDNADIQDFYVYISFINLLLLLLLFVIYVDIVVISKRSI